MIPNAATASFPNSAIILVITPIEMGAISKLIAAGPAI